MKTRKIRSEFHQEVFQAIRDGLKNRNRAEGLTDYICEVADLVHQKHTKINAIRLRMALTAGFVAGIVFVCAVIGAHTYLGILLK